MTFFLYFYDNQRFYWSPVSCCGFFHWFYIFFSNIKSTNYSVSATWWLCINTLSAKRKSENLSKRPIFFLLTEYISDIVLIHSAHALYFLYAFLCCARNSCRMKKYKVALNVLKRFTTVQLYVNNLSLKVFIFLNKFF